MTVAPSYLNSMSSQILEATDVSRQHTICRDLEWLTRSVKPSPGLAYLLGEGISTCSRIR